MRYTVREALEAAQHWLREDAACPGETTPEEILRVIDGALAAPRSTIGLALEEAEAFILGFEDDEAQEGVPALLSLIGLARRQEEQRPDALAVLRAFVSACGGNPPDWLRGEFAMAEDAIAKAEGRS